MMCRVVCAHLEVDAFVDGVVVEFGVVELVLGDAFVGGVEELQHAHAGRDVVVVV